MKQHFFRHHYSNPFSIQRLLPAVLILAGFSAFFIISVFVVRKSEVNAAVSEETVSLSESAKRPAGGSYGVSDDAVLCGVQMENGDQLSATVKVYLPEEALTFDPTVPYYVYTTVSGEKSGASVTLRAFLPQLSLSSRSASFTLLLDSQRHPFVDSFGRIESGGMLYYEIEYGGAVTGGNVMAAMSGGLSPIGSAVSHGVEYDGENSRYLNFYPGEDISVSAYAVSSEREDLPSLEAYDEANSLFATAEAEGDVLTVSVNHPRHLLNLNTDVSGLSVDALGNGVEKIDVTQTADIDGEEIGTIQPIRNTRISTYDGGIYEIRNLLVRQDKNEPTGLFSVFDGDEITSVTLNKVTIEGGEEPTGGLIGTLNGDSAEILGCTLIDTKIRGEGITGGLVGTASSGISVSGSSLYMTKESCTDSAIAGDSETKAWLSGGSIAGGLIGISTAALTIEKSFAATVVYADGENTRVGGLVGNALGAISVKESYADCYLHGDVIGGMAGGCSGAASFQSCYSAGFVLDPEEAEEPEIEGLPATGGTIAAQFVPNASVRVGSGITDSYSIFAFDDITKAKTGKSMPDYSGLTDAFVTKDELHRIDNGFTLWENVNVEIFSDTMRTGNSEQQSYQLASYLKNGGSDDYSEFPRTGLPHYGDFLAVPMEYEIIAYDPLAKTTTWDALGQRIMKPLYRASYFSVTDKPFSESAHNPPKHEGYEFVGYQFPGNVNRDLICTWDATTTIDDMQGLERIATFTPSCFGVKTAKLELNYRKVYTINFQDTKGSSGSKTTKQFREAGERILDSWPIDSKGDYRFLGYSFAKDSEIIPVINQKQTSTLLGDLIDYEGLFTDENKNTITLYLRWEKIE